MLQAFQTISPLALIFYLAAFLVALLVIVFVHEFGHFIVGRWCGVKAEVFSLGFGRELFGFTDRHGTRWRLAALPLGGYVRFEGDANAASLPSGTVSSKQSPTSLHAQPVWERAAIVAAGPFANFLLAILIFTAAFMIIGMPHMKPVVSTVIADSAAEAAGLKPMDTIISVDGVATASFEAVQEAVWMRAGEELDVVVNRGGEMLSLKLTPKPSELPDGFGGTVKVGLLGVRHDLASDEPVYERFALPQALMKGVDRTWYIVATTGKFIGKMLTGEQSVKQIGGAASIAKGAGDAASSGVMSFVYFIGLLSVSIGLINLFPVPMLDGGHLVYYAIEALRGKPLGQEAQEWGYRIGFSLVVMLLVVGVFNDVGRIINVMFGT